MAHVLERMRRCAAPMALLAIGVACAPGDRPPDILLVSIDTLRADHLGAYGSDHGLTPHIDRLAEESAVFSHAYAPAPFTLASVSAMLTGRYPAELGIASNRSSLAADVPTLAGALRRRGYRTGAVVSNFVLRRGSGVASGFDLFDDRTPQAEAGREMPERNARDTTDAALLVHEALSEDGSRPWFLWVHYQDPHGPYLPPAGFRERHLERERRREGGDRRLPIASGNRGLGAIPAYQALEERDEVAWYRSGYHGEIAFADEQIGRLLARLAERGVLAGAVVALTADHGEGLGENDYWFAHGEYLNDPLVRIPLVIRAPGRTAQRRDDAASVLDLPATLLARAGAERPARTRGRDLFAPDAANEASEVFLSTLAVSTRPRHGLVRDGHKLVVSESDGRAEVDRLGGASADARPPDPAIAAALRRDLERWLVAHPTPERAVPPPLREEERERLRALGYLDDGSR